MAHRPRSNDRGIKNTPSTDCKALTMPWLLSLSFVFPVDFQVLGSRTVIHVDIKKIDIYISQCQ